MKQFETLPNMIKLKMKNVPRKGISMFLAEWCGHCVTAKPEIIRIAKRYPKIKMYYMMEGERKMPSRVKSYPSYYVNGKESNLRDIKNKLRERVYGGRDRLKRGVL